MQRISHYTLHIPGFRPFPLERAPDSIPPNSVTSFSNNAVADSSPPPSASLRRPSSQRQVAIKSGSPSRNRPISRPNVTEPQEVTLQKFPAPQPLTDPPQSFVRYREYLYARVHVPLGANLDISFPIRSLPSLPARNPRAQVPPITLPTPTSSSADSRSPESTARN